MITSLNQLADKLRIDREVQAIAAQTTGLTAFLKRVIPEIGETILVGVGPNGKVETAGDCFKRLAVKAAPARARK